MDFFIYKRASYSKTLCKIELKTTVHLNRFESKRQIYKLENPPSRKNNNFHFYMAPIPCRIKAKTHVILDL